MFHRVRNRHADLVGLALRALADVGQEIHWGEEAGMRQWATAIEQQASMEWEVHCPHRLGAQVDGQKVTEHDELDLTISLRSRRADDLHAWVAALLAGELG